MTTIPLGDVAPISRRVIAYIIDALIAAVLPIIGLVVTVTLMVGAVQSPETASSAVVSVAVAAGVFGLLILAWFVVYTFMQTGRGSIGMRAQRIRLVRAADLAPLTFWPALLRNIVFAITGAFVVGMFSPLFDGSGRYQGWHDKVGGAVMLEATAVPALADAAASAEAPVDSVPLPRPPAVGRALRTPSQAPVAFPAPAQSSPPQPAPSPSAPAEALPEETIVASRPAGPGSAGLPADPLISFVPGVTQPGPPAAPAPAPAAPAAPEAPAPAAPAPAQAAAAPTPSTAPPVSAPTAAPVDHDDDIESTRISIPGHRLVFTWDDGQRVTVSGRTVFGRNPEQEPGAVVIAVRDETRSLSKTHFEAASEPSGGWIMDRDSTNGTVVVREGVRIACPPGQRVPLRLGDAVEIGDRILTIGGFA